MTINIPYDQPRDREKAWANRKEKESSDIRFHKGELVGVQEALMSQLRDLEKLLPEFAGTGVGRTDGKEAGEYSAILYRKSRFRLLETNTFWLSETPETPGSMGWDAAYPRIVTWAKFRDRVSKKTFSHFNTHFDHRGDQARAQSASLILKRIGEIVRREPFVLTGDLNVREDSEAYKTLKAGSANVRLADAKYASSTSRFRWACAAPSSFWPWPLPPALPAGALPSGFLPSLLPTGAGGAALTATFFAFASALAGLGSTFAGLFATICFFGFRAADLAFFLANAVSFSMCALEGCAPVEPDPTTVNPSLRFS
jgi:endonuclease/exonuclease/phosphatase family metal-dependent hydrolase